LTIKIVPILTGRKAATNDDLDDDEKAMMKGEDDGEEGGSEPQGTVLLTQPSSVSGGNKKDVIRCVSIDDYSVYAYTFKYYEIFVKI
jgi:hypothetical protein